MADYPSDGKISFKWLEEIVSNDVEPFTGGGRTGETSAVFGLVMYHLRHLGLIREEKIDFDIESADYKTLQEKKNEAADFWN